MEGIHRDTLVVYNPPQEVTEQMQLKKKLIIPTGKKKGILPPVEVKPTLEEYLNYILPPRQWSENEKDFIEYPSSLQSSRQDVIILKEKLEAKLLERHAKDLGTCPVKEELYSQCFDEIIRQIAIKCPERGLLLMRVRDEIKMTIGAYQTLYKNSVIFGSRKQLESEEGKTEVFEKIKELEQKKINLENKKIRVLKTKDALIRKYEEQRSVDQAKRTVEREFWDKQNEHLDDFLKRLQSSA